MQNSKKKVRYSKKNRRFLDTYDMAQAKHAEAIYNAQIKRGEKPQHLNYRHIICNCGARGCIFISGWSS